MKKAALKECVSLVRTPRDGITFTIDSIHRNIAQGKREIINIIIIIIIIIMTVLPSYF